MTINIDEAVRVAGLALAHELGHTQLSMTEPAPNTARITRAMLTAALPHIIETICDALESVDSNDWAWRGMDVNTGSVAAQFIRDGLVLPPLDGERNE